MREGGAGEGLGPLGFSPEPFSQGELGTRARKGGGESTAGGFVSAAGLQLLHKMEGGEGVSGEACVGCPGCYWVGEAGDSRIPLPAAQRAPFPRAAKVKSSAPWLPPRSGPRRTQQGAGPTLGRLHAGSDSPGSRTGGGGPFLASNFVAPSPTEKEFPQPGLAQAMSPSSPGRAGLGDFGARGGLALKRGRACKLRRADVAGSGLWAPAETRGPQGLWASRARNRIGEQGPCCEPLLRSLSPGTLFQVQADALCTLMLFFSCLKSGPRSEVHSAKGKNP